VKSEARRAGGLFISDLSAESGAATLIEALDLYPGARIEFLGYELDGEALQERNALGAVAEAAVGETRRRGGRRLHVVAVRLLTRDLSRLHEHPVELVGMFDERLLVERRGVLLQRGVETRHPDALRGLPGTTEAHEGAVRQRVERHGGRLT